MGVISAGWGPMMGEWFSNPAPSVGDGLQRATHLLPTTLLDSCPWALVHLSNKVMKDMCTEQRVAAKHCGHA